MITANCQSNITFQTERIETFKKINEINMIAVNELECFHKKWSHYLKETEINDEVTAKANLEAHILMQNVC